MPSNLGIIASSASSVSTLTTPVHLGTGSGNVNSTSIATGTLTPSSNALLLVAFRWAGDRTAQTPTITTTLSNVGTWTATSGVYAGSTDGGTIWLAYAQITGAPGTGTITATIGDSAAGRIILATEITGHNTTTPIRQTKLGTAQTFAGAGTYTITPDSTPLTTSTLFGALTSTLTVAPGSGSTELFELFVASGARVLQTQYDPHPPAANMAWDLNAAGTVAGIIYEIASA
jgi:hypothetical protein